ncbi:heterokaryon incompatibility protein-domain-containing protein, partial [Microdochium bolleyi]
MYPVQPVVAPDLARVLFPPLEDPGKHIRLLRIDPATFDEPITATMITCLLDEAPSFHAVSYAWGADQPQCELLLDGRPFLIRQNCQYALQQARHFDSAELVWIDAVCINQSNTREKSAQVAIMGDIYARAVKVLACIGPNGPDCEFIEKIIPGWLEYEELHAMEEETEAWIAFNRIVEDTYDGDLGHAEAM